MLEAIKKYWDIFGGVVVGLLLSIISEFKLERVQLAYSMIILMLVSIGVLKILKQSFEKTKTKRKQTIIEKAIDSQKPIKAIRIAQEPTKDGEEVGKLILILWRELKKMFEKLKLFFDKFKGVMLSVILGVFTIVEYCGGYLNQLFKGVFVVGGVDLVTLTLLVLSIAIGIFSNFYSKEQKEKIKALFKKSTTNELVIAEIKKTLKSDQLKLKELIKIADKKQCEFDNLNSELTNLNNTLEAKQEMKNMVPALATEEDCLIALTHVNETKKKIEEKQTEINEVKKSITTLKETIASLQKQL